MNTPQFISLDLIDPNPYQPRQSENAEAVIELATDILHHATDDFDGLMQAPTVRQWNGRYQLAFGHTRKAAFEELLNQGHKRYGQMRVNVRELTDVQMFELAVAENIKRRDLNPLEQAEAMRRYMDEFGKTSKQAGEFFGCSEENVRAKVRLLNLPAQVQEQMHAGEINETAARSLLSMLKVASPEVIVRTAEKIRKEKNNALPDDVIESAIDHLDNVVELHSGNGEKPRAGRNGWPLDMKKFPNHLLPAMTEQAVGVYEKQIAHLAEPPACNTCPYYTRVRGSHFCGLKVCYERKGIAWERYLVDQASKSLKIPVYDKETDGGYVLLVGYESSHTKVFEKRHPGLRLLPRREADRYASQWGFDGLNDHVFVIATGQAMDKLDSTGRNRSKGGKKTEKEKAEMRMMRVYRMRRKEFLWEFTAVAMAIFDGVPVEAVKEIKSWKFVGVDDAIPDEWLKGKRATAQIEADFERRELIWKMIGDVCSHYTRSSMATILNKLQKQASEWSLKIPARLNRLAEQFDAEIAAAGERKTK